MGGGGGCCVGKCCVINCCIGKAIKDFFCSDSCCVGNSTKREESYDVNTADLQATVKIQKALTEFRSDTQSRSAKLENEIIKESRESLDNFIDELRTYNNIRYGNRRLNINISSIEREQRNTEDQIHGFIVKRVIKRISLDDNECCEILKLNPGSEKSNKLDAFYKKVLQEAVNELSHILRNTMENQTDSVEKRIQQRIDGIVDVCETKTVNFEKIQKMKMNDEDKIEQEQMRLSHYIALCDYGLSILD